MFSGVPSVLARDLGFFFSVEEGVEAADLCGALAAVGFGAGASFISAGAVPSADLAATRGLLGERGDAFGTAAVGSGAASALSLALAPALLVRFLAGSTGASW